MRRASNGLLAALPASSSLGDQGRGRGGFDQRQGSAEVRLLPSKRAVTGVGPPIPRWPHASSLLCSSSRTRNWALRRGDALRGCASLPPGSQAPPAKAVTSQRARDDALGWERCAHMNGGVRDRTLRQPEPHRHLAVSKVGLGGARREQCSPVDGEVAHEHHARVRSADFDEQILSAQALAQAKPHVHRRRGDSNFADCTRRRRADRIRAGKDKPACQRSKGPDQRDPATSDQGPDGHAALPLPAATGARSSPGMAAG